ncbi:protein of unknown function [Methylocaldum szegediense]|uniref:Uncharacterized protein n=1 Tax=Methylocaldum szegediense TaxID=73780 RepID=A0ABM9HZ51_9GAMM|nr:protein of unknown function [Methylocaldum szegediense]
MVAEQETKVLGFVLMHMSDRIGRIGYDADGKAVFVIASITAGSGAVAAGDGLDVGMTGIGPEGHAFEIYGYGINYSGASAAGSQGQRRKRQP